MSRKVNLSSYEEALDWSVLARKTIKDMGLGYSAPNLRLGLKTIGAPFFSEGHVLIKYGKTTKTWLEDVIAHEARGGMTPVGDGSVSINPGDHFDWDAAWDAMSAKSDDTLLANYKETHRSVGVKSDGPIVVICFGDMHIGSNWTDYKRLGALSALLQVDRVFGVFVGDLLDQMIWNKVKDVARTTPITVMEEVQLGVGYLKRANAKGHMLGGVLGNHDLVSKKMAGASYILLAMQEAGVEIPVAKHELFLDIAVGTQTYKWEIRHNYPGKSIATNAWGVKKWHRRNAKDSEVVVAGDIHVSDTSFEDLHGKDRHGIQVGTFKRPDDWVAEMGFRRGKYRSDYGVLLWPDRHQIKVMDTEDALEKIGVDASTIGGDLSTTTVSTRTTGTTMKKAMRPTNGATSGYTRKGGSKARKVITKGKGRKCK